MAILSKIRERSLFLIIIIALALFSFVIGDVFTRGGFGGQSNSIGEINGENISREEFAQMVEQQKAMSGGRGSNMQYVNMAWENLVREKVYKHQLEKSGVTVGEKDVWDEILKQPFVQNGPQFKNEAGLFDEDKFKEYIATLQDAKDDSEQDRQAWLSWLDYERNIKNNLELRTYNNLVSSGLGATFKEGERHYMADNTKLDLEYVYVPYTYIADSLVTLTDGEIEQYVKDHPNDYKAEASRDISFVKFDIKASPEDEAAIKAEVEKIINDREEYSSAAKGNVNVKGLSSAENIEDFFRNNPSDLPLDNNFYTKDKLSPIIKDTVFKLNVGDVYGPYKEGNYFKVTKLVAVKQMPDSVKARHILIPFLGATNDPSITQTEAQAKATADSLLTVVKKDKSQFADLAKKLSSDKVSGAKGGDLDWFVYQTMVPEFRDFTFENKTGDMGVVKSQFGFHIIDIQEQKNLQKNVKLATFAREIVASDETESAAYQKAETFASEITDEKDIEELAKEQGLTVQPAVGLKAMDERVSNLNNQRQIITWAFDPETEVNNIKRFDVDGGYVVAKLTAKHKKGLNIGAAKATLRTKLLNEKKADKIKEQMKGDNLQDIAKSFNTNVQSSKAVSLGSPTLPGIGRAEEIVSTLVVLKENVLYTDIDTKNGVFAAKITKKDSPQPLENYASSITAVKNANKAKGAKVYSALKKFADIEDNRATFY
ncbi:peptidylprolyl isomerase [Aureibaculum sp. 2210JD6-5]|uniref:peptidylprolyl isomerase n=1 Tax=Aureibaculum sp. 2210JD6-5 TaxID=3103957 RepID=UPI002AAD0F47|nr:peptidylprolyl isomerase [Aureibaculum sp. 2210JD6-5]MDY7394779.1 peptidylprolyl isomerase [Aureibaculum sp. 2210JD6-5]